MSNTLIQPLSTSWLDWLHIFVCLLPTFLMFSSSSCLASLAVCSSLIRSSRSSCSACCLSRRSRRFCRASRCGAGRPWRSRLTQFWMAVGNEREIQRQGCDFIQGCACKNTNRNGRSSVRNCGFVIMSHDKPGHQGNTFKPTNTWKLNYFKNRNYNKSVSGASFLNFLLYILGIFWL